MIEKIYISICALVLSCCATSPNLDFCETWGTDDGSGESVAWIPNHEQMNFILEKLGPKRQFICAEKNLSGHVSVVNFDGEYYSTNFKHEDGVLDFIDEEIFVGTH